MTVVPCNSELLLTSFADNVFLGTYYRQYLFRRDDLFSYLNGYPEHLFQLDVGYQNTGSSHGIIENLYQAFTMYIRHSPKCFYCIDSFHLHKHSSRQGWFVLLLYGEGNRKRLGYDQLSCLPKVTQLLYGGGKIVTLSLWSQSLPFNHQIYCKRDYLQLFSEAS